MSATRKRCPACGQTGGIYFLKHGNQREMHCRLCAKTLPKLPNPNPPPPPRKILRKEAKQRSERLRRRLNRPFL